jgi:cytochrome b561
MLHMHAQTWRAGDSGDGIATARYSSAAVVLHWGMAAIVLAQLLLGWWMLNVPKSPPGLRAGWFNLHKSIGLALGLLLLARLAWRSRHAPPSLSGLPDWQRRAARVNHALLYACLGLLPLTGYLGSSFTRYPIRFFGITVPSLGQDWPAAKQLMSTLHYSCVWLLMVLLALHVAAAVSHAWHGHPVAGRMGLRFDRRRN